MTRAVVLGALVVVASGCSRKSKYEKLCGRIEELACLDDVRSANGLDRLTIVVGELSEESKTWEVLFAPLANVAPADRLRLLKASVGEVTGTDWQCPALDAMWAGEDACPSK